MRLALVLLLGCNKPAPPATVSNSSPPARLLPGDCVDPKADAKARLEAGPTGIDTGPGTFEIRPLEDLDGDALTDTTVFYGFGLLEYSSIYVMRGRCGHFVGTLIGSFRVETERTKGLLDLTVSEAIRCEGARCGCEPGSARLTFSGTEYEVDGSRVTDSRATDCPDGSDPHGDPP